MTSEAAFEREYFDPGDAPRSKAADAEPLPVLRADDIRPATDCADFVEAMLIDGQLSVLYGEPGCGKSFLATDLALHVALGLPWFGRAVDQGPVLYVAAEGSYGIRNRIAAFRQHHVVEHTIPLGVVTCGVDLLNADADTPRLLATCRALTDAPPRLIIIDTLSRVMAGGNENSPEDMGGLVKNVDRLRLDTGAHVLLVHHAGKDATKGARGHSLWRGASDTDIEVTNNADVRTATVTKQRDMICDGALAFRLEPVELGINRRAKPVTSCVIIPAEDAGEAQRQRPLTNAERIAFEALTDLMARDGAAAPPQANGHIPPGRPVVPEDAWRLACYSRSITAGRSESAKRQAFGRAATGLQVIGRIGVWQENVWLV